MSFEQNQAAAAASKGFEAGAGVIRDEASCIVQESSGDSGSTLKAHDYIGLSEVTSMPVKNEKALPDLNLGETELRLGPPKNSSAGSDAKIVAAAAEAPLKFHEKVIPEAAKAEAEQDLQKSVFWPAQRMIPQQQQQQDQNASPDMSSAFSIKNSNNKRAFSEAIGGNSFVDGRSTAAAPNPPPASGNLKAPPVMPSSMYPWSSSSKQLPAAWRMGLDQSKGSFGPFPSPRIHPQQPKLDSSPENSSGLTKDDAAEDAVPPSSSPPVVGWPPVQSFRKNTLASHPAPPQPKSEPNTKTSAAVTAAAAAASPAPAPSPAPSQAPATPLFVKVYMDGVPIGRKVDLKTNNSYDKLSSVLEDMFHRFITGQEASSSRDASEKKLNFLHSSDFVLTYEDKDGDLMLVGDVPWGMFTGTVKRLRIMKGSEAIGLAPRAPAGDKAAC